MDNLDKLRAARQGIQSIVTLCHREMDNSTRPIDYAVLLDIIELAEKTFLETRPIIESQLSEPQFVPRDLIFARKQAD